MEHKDNCTALIASNKISRYNKRAKLFTWIAVGLIVALYIILFTTLARFEYDDPRLKSSEIAITVAAIASTIFSLLGYTYSLLSIKFSQTGFLSLGVSFMALIPAILVFFAMIIIVIPAVVAITVLVTVFSARQWSKPICNCSEINKAIEVQKVSEIE